MYSMPGAFPQDVASNNASLKVSDVTIDALHTQQLNSFESNQKVALKTIGQSHLINQLDSLVYILVGYQLIKYCHSASLIPIIGHIIIQKLLCCDSFTSNNESSRDFLSFVNDMETANIEHNIDPNISINSVFKKIKLSIYWKTFILIAYHIAFVAFWLIPLANKGKLHLIINGTWWFVSFIGESIPKYETISEVENFQNKNFFIKLIDFGIIGLILSDLIIFLIQLILFQAIYKQSTLSPIGRKLNAKEIEILRPQTDYSSVSASSNDNSLNTEDEVSFALHVKLYDSLNLTS